jgi:2-dehydro-3-deoxygluconokinase
MAVEITAIGEAMLELSGPSLEAQQLRFAGDTLNTAVSLARLGIAAAYVTALGRDPFSEAMVNQWHSEGLNIDAVARIGSALPGLYAIQTDADGERSFYYWRKDSAARQMLDGDGVVAVQQALAGGHWIYLSGITLAILEGERRQRLLSLLRDAADQGQVIIFDPNYRPSLWDSEAQARSALMEVSSLVHTVLPTFADDRALFGDVTPRDTAARYIDAGANEVVVKCGPDPAWIYHAGTHHQVAPPASVMAVDSSGAGDAFNAGYIAARLRGRTPVEAASAGHRLAAVTLQFRGAIAPRSAVDAAMVLA